MTQDWATPQTTQDLLVRTERRLSALERRDGALGAITTIIGPGQNSRATLIGDWNQPLASNNGYFWSRAGGLHAPDGVRVWTGSVVARSDNSGMQQVWNTDDLNDVLYYMRTFTDDGTGQGRTFSEWRNFATPTGFIELNNFGETVTDLLADMAAEIDDAAQALLFYEQAGEPVPGVSGVPAEIPVGSVWVDTDDNRHTYSWDGTAWVSVESTLFATIEAELAAQQDAIEAAAAAAADAMDFAVALTKVYRQATAPSNPDADGRALVADDVWFDSDDDNRMYTWTGSWTLLGISTEDYAADAATAAQIAAISAAAIQSASDASAAQAAAIAAAATDATTKANAAQAAAIAVANTKSTVFRQGTIPTSLSIGDVWFDTANDNRIYRAAAAGATTIGSGAWVLTQIGTTAIANDAITSAQILAGSILTTDLIATAIDGMTVTGATLQTVVTAARGIKMNSTGLTAYDNAGTPALTIVSATGAISTTGAILTSGSVTGAVVTGGTVQSEATAARGIKMNSANLIAYNSSGVAQVTIDAATGAITLTGAMTGGGTITGPTFQTSASANTGIKISSGGLIGYNGTVAKFSLNASTGILTLDGGVFTAGSIDGAVVTGGTVQTEVTVGRGIKMNSAGMVMYAPSPASAGTALFTLDATTGAMTLNGTISALNMYSAIVTGGVIQTSGTTDEGVKMTSSGLFGYNTATHVTTFTLDAVTGVLTLAGGVLTGGSLTGGIVTGGTLQSEATAGRGVKINSAGLVLYAPSPTTAGTAMFTLDAATGSIVLAGSMTGAGTITGPVFQTSATGQRIIIDGPGDIIQFFSGVSGETAGFLDPSGSAISLGPPFNAAAPDHPEFSLSSGIAGLGQALIDASQIVMDGTFKVNGVSEFHGNVHVVTPSLLEVDSSIIGAANAHAGFRGPASAESITSGTTQVAGLTGTSNHNAGGVFSIASSVITVSTAGDYQVSGSYMFGPTSSATARGYMSIEMYAASPAATPAAGSGTLIASTEGLVWASGNCGLTATQNVTMVAGQRLRMVVFQNSGAPINNLGASGHTNKLSIRRIS